MDSDLLHGFYLDKLLVEPLNGQIVRPDSTVRLPPQAMEVLLALASRPCKLVTRGALIDKVWGPGQGSHEALGRAISEIRHALGDSPDQPHFIQTLPRRGYRLIVQPMGEPQDAAGAPSSPNARHGKQLSLFDNLRQRGVLEAAIAYLVSGWLIIQVADIVFDQLHLPAWSGTFVTALVIAGFPIAIFLSWLLEFRDGRAVLDQPDLDVARRRQFSRTYLSVIGALAMAAVGVYIYDSNVGLPGPQEQALAQPPAERKLPPVLDNSIAVLPFLNLDGSEETQIFSNGLVDDVITRLSRVPGLLVSSRGDAFTLEPNSASQRVRERLRVALYVEGSVQTVNERMRIIVQLIDSETGFHVLSRSFDRPREDFFAVRDEITELTVANVRVALPPETQAMANVLGEDPSLDVYVLYRRGVEASRLPETIPSLESALRWFDQALAIDGEYAAAHAGKCSTYVSAYPVAGDPAYIEKAEAACGEALELNPNLDVVHTALGELYKATGRYGEAEEAYLEALAIDPTSVASLSGLGVIYMLQQRPEEAEERLRQAIGLHPGDWSAYNSLGYFLYNSGRYAEAAEQYEYVVGLDPGNILGFSNLATSYMLAGDFEAAAPAYQRAIEIEPRPATYSNLGLMYYYLGRFPEAIDAHQRAVALAPNDHLAWSNLGDAFWVSGNAREARDAFLTAERLATAALQVNRNDPLLLMDLAWISTTLEKPGQADDFMSRARAQAPDDPYVYYIDGLISLRNGDRRSALSSFVAALDRGYSDVMLAADPQLADLRGDPRFRSALETGKP